MTVPSLNLVRIQTGGGGTWIQSQKRVRRMYPLWIWSRLVSEKVDLPVWIWPGPKGYIGHHDLFCCRLHEVMTTSDQVQAHFFFQVVQCLVFCTKMWSIKNIFYTSVTGRTNILKFCWVYTVDCPQQLQKQIWTAIHGMSFSGCSTTYTHLEAFLFFAKRSVR